MMRRKETFFKNRLLSPLLFISPFLKYKPQGLYCLVNQIVFKNIGFCIKEGATKYLWDAFFKRLFKRFSLECLHVGIFFGLQSEMPLYEDFVNQVAEFSGQKRHLRP